MVQSKLDIVQTILHIILVDGVLPEVNVEIPIFVGLKLIPTVMEVIVIMLDIVVLQAILIIVKDVILIQIVEKDIVWPN